jgi:quinoprotein relay system zinc metallohydrolase 2
MKGIHASMPIMLAGMMLGAACAADPAAPLAMAEVKPGVFVHAGKVEDWGPANGGDVANIGFIVGRRCVAVIDTGGTPAIGRALLASVERTTQLPICWVINTHAHPDHVLGNAAFVEAGATKTRFVAHARFPRALGARETYYLNAMDRDFGVRLTHASIIYPETHVETSLDLDLGERILTLRAWPTAHTDNDLTVYDQRTRTLFASDLLFVRHLPVLDGSLRGWLAATAELGRMPVDTVVPGHGPVSTDAPAAFGAQAIYLEDLARDTRAALRDHRTIQQAVDSIEVPAGSGWLLGERFQKRNVTAAYAELEWEDVAPTSPRK